MIGRLGLSGLRSRRVPGQLGLVDAGPGFLEAVLAVTHLCLDVGRGDGLGAYVVLHLGLELAPVHCLQQGRLVGEFQGGAAKVSTEPAMSGYVRES